MNKFFVLLLISFLTASGISGQDIEYARKNISQLASEKMHGRGYVKKGDRKAAKFIRKEFKKNGLKKVDGSYFQDFKFNINTFPKKIAFSIDGTELRPAADYVIYASSPGRKGSYVVAHLEGDSLSADDFKDFYAKNDLAGKFLLIEKSNKDSLARYLPKNFEGVIYLSDHIYWHVSRGRKLKEFMSIDLNSAAAPDQIRNISIDADNKFMELYKTQNVLGMVKGKKYPEKFLMFTAHYDHLGEMGKGNYFPGANDNASGVAMLMDLARHYARKENTPDHSILFVAFAGEEAGLLGSFYFANYPLIPLENIEFLINLDMVGTGSEGITVVNATIFEEEFEKLQQINKQKKYLASIKKRGEACNSDHCPLYKKGVPSFFIYTRGREFSEYHNPADRAENLPLTEYGDLFRLMTDFVKSF